MRHRTSLRESLAGETPVLPGEFWAARAPEQNAARQVVRILFTILCKKDFAFLEDTGRKGTGPFSDPFVIE